MRELGVYLLDVGQGDASIILPPDGEGDAIVFDCRDEHVVRQSLDAWEIERIEAVIISHLDWDHIAGAAALLAHYGDRIGTVFLSSDRDITDRHDRAQTAKRLVDVARDGRADSLWELVDACRDHRPVAQGEDWSVRVVAPEHAQMLAQHRNNPARWEDPNTASTVLRVEMAGRVVLIGGDAPLVTWAELPEGEHQADVFRIPHHGGAIEDGGLPDGWSVERLYAEVSADTTIVSVGTRNRYDHPRPEWISPIMRGACRMMCTQVTERCQPGIRASAQTLRDQLVRQWGLTEAAPFAEPLWRHYRDTDRNTGRSPDEMPCAGTVVVRLAEDSTIRVLPSTERHADVIDEWDQPLCRPLPDDDDEGVEVDDLPF